MSIVTPSLTYFGDPTKGRPLFNADIYVGEPDTDPQITANQKQVSLRLEDGTTVAVGQPVSTGSGGYVTYNGSYAVLVVDGDYSVKVLNNAGAQALYIPSNSGIFDASQISLTINSLARDSVQSYLSNIAPQPDYAAVRALDSSDLADGDYIYVQGFSDPWQVKTGTETDIGWRIVFNDDSNRYVESTSKIVSVDIFGAYNDGSNTAATTAACQAAIDYADANNISLVLFPQGVYDVTGLTFPDDISPMGEDSAFGLTFNFTAQNRWGSVIQNTTTADPTLRWTKVAGSSHVIPSHLKITGNALQTAVVKFDEGVFNNSGMQNCGIYALESGTAGPGADYCIEFGNGGFDFYMSHCYTGKGDVANIKVSGDTLALHLSNMSGDVSGDCLVETDFSCDITIVSHYFENFSAAFNLVNNNATLTNKRPSLNIFTIRNTTINYNSLWHNTATDSEFVIPKIEVTGYTGQYPAYLFTDSTGTNDQEFPGTRSGFTFNTGTGAVNFRNENGTVPGNLSSIDIGGSNLLYDVFAINSFNTPVVIDEIRGGTEGRVITIVEIGGPGGSGNASFGTAANSIAITSLTRSGTTVTATTAATHYLSTGLFVDIAGAVETEYNVTNAEITVTGATTFTYEIVGTPTSPATGTITAENSNANIRGNDGLPIYGVLRSAWTFQYVDGFWEYLTNNDVRGLSSKRMFGPYASNALAAAGGVQVGQQYYDDSSGDRVVKVRF